MEADQSRRGEDDRSEDDKALLVCCAALEYVVRELEMLAKPPHAAIALVTRARDQIQTERGELNANFGCEARKPIDNANSA